MARISNMLGLIGKLDSPFITVHQDRCVLVRNRNADCLKCAAACTSGCIAYADNELAIDPEKCIGCGTCATVCPTCALEAHHPNDAQLENECLSCAQACEGQVVIACGQLLDKAASRIDPDKVARVECLGRVEESLLTRLAAAGVRSVTLVHDSCEACAYQHGLSTAALVCETERELLSAWHGTLEVRLAEKFPRLVKAQECDYDKARRRAFEQGGSEAQRIGAVAAEFAVRDALGRPDKAEEPRYVKVMEDGTLPHFVPDRRERLLDALAALGEPEDVMIATRLWGHVIIDTDACISCRMCATFCPTGALRKFDDEEGAFGVEHYPGDCVKCRCCTTICPAHALELSEEVFARDMLAGMTDRYEMKPIAVPHGQPHAIRDSLQTMMKTDQVYER